jgi:hypothetical protein
MVSDLAVHTITFRINYCVSIVGAAEQQAKALTKTVNFDVDEQP